MVHSDAQPKHSLLPTPYLCVKGYVHLGCPIFHLWMVAKQYFDYVTESLYFGLVALW